MNKTIDFRSDTVTQPTHAMKEAMMVAPLGDDVFGDDPTVNRLQEKVASLLGFEDALYMPTGTQSNLCALMAHCGRGDEYLVGQMAHTYRWEAGGAAVLGSIQPQPLEQNADGTIALEKIEASIKPDDPHFAMSRLLALENTWNGRLMGLDYLLQATTLAKSRGLATHLDGARLFNAAVALADQSQQTTAVALRAITQPFDSVSVCFSKGLGAPMGSMLCGSKMLIRQARRVRKMAGGALRQVGMVAAAANYALDHHVERLREDHAKAVQLAAGLTAMNALTVDGAHTNMVFVELNGRWRDRQTEFQTHLNAAGILTTGTYKLRFVTHLDLSAEDIDRALTHIEAFFKA
jgi:threonine aldolase